MSNNVKVTLTEYSCVYSVPPNVKFEVDDLEEPWTYHTKFDYIHTRVMTSSIADWKRFFKQSYKLSRNARSLSPTNGCRGPSQQPPPSLS